MLNVGDGVGLRVKVKGFHLAHKAPRTQTWRCITNRTWSHELTLPSAKRWERCHLPPHSPELQRLWWPDSECQAEETEMHGCHFLIFHCDNHNVCTESLRGNLWGRFAAGTSKMSACVRVKRNHNKHKHEARACENVCERREPSV